MPLAITQDHRELADVVRSFARGHGLREETRHSLEKPPQATDTGVVWQQIADLGWAGLHVAEEKVLAAVPHARIVGTVHDLSWT